MDYTALSAWAALGTAFVAAVAVVVESRRARFALGVQLLAGYTDRFDNPAIRKARRAAASGLLVDTPQEAEDILDFFDELGLLVRRGALDCEAVWHAFATWVFVYVHAASLHIQRSRTEDPTVWSELLYLHDRLLRLERRRRRFRKLRNPVDDAYVHQFLRDESHLE